VLVRWDEAKAAAQQSVERWFSIGVASNGVPMSLAYLWTDAGAGLRIRLITARQATATKMLAII
jgi:uncharacterized DUF497 family protein